MSLINVPVSTPVGEAQILLMKQYARPKQKLKFRGLYMLQPAIPASIRGKLDIRSGKPTLSVRSIVESDDCR